MKIEDFNNLTFNQAVAVLSGVSRELDVLGNVRTSLNRQAEEVLESYKAMRHARPDVAIAVALVEVMLAEGKLN